MRSPLLAFCLFLSSFGPKLLTEADLQRIDLEKMTETEIENIHGPGRVIPAPPTGDRIVLQPGQVCKMWGDEESYLCVIFEGGKSRGSWSRIFEGKRGVFR